MPRSIEEEQVIFTSRRDQVSRFLREPEFEDLINDLPDQTCLIDIASGTGAIISAIDQSLHNRSKQLQSAVGVDSWAIHSQINFDSQLMPLLNKGRYALNKDEAVRNLSAYQSYCDVRLVQSDALTFLKQYSLDSFDLLTGFGLPCTKCPGDLKVEPILDLIDKAHFGRPVLLTMGSFSDRYVPYIEKAIHRPHYNKWHLYARYSKNPEDVGWDTWVVTNRKLALPEAA